MAYIANSVDPIRPMSSLIKVHNVCLCKLNYFGVNQMRVCDLIANGMDPDQTA